MRKTQHIMFIIRKSCRFRPSAHHHKPQQTRSFIFPFSASTHVCPVDSNREYLFFFSFSLIIRVISQINIKKTHEEIVGWIREAQ